MINAVKDACCFCRHYRGCKTVEIRTSQASQTTGHENIIKKL